MDNPLYTLPMSNLNDVSLEEKQKALSALEHGQVVYFPNYYFSPEKQNDEILSETILDSRHKNISYDYQRQKLGAINQQHANPELSQLLSAFMQGFALYSRELIDTLFP